MSIFFETLQAINNPQQQASVEQLSKVNTSFQQLANSQGMNTNQMQSMLTALGGALQPVLKQQRQTLGNSQMDSMLQSIGGAGGATALQSMIPPQLQQQLARTVATRTGMNPTLIQTMLPQVLPAVMGLFNMGSTKPGSSAAGNPIVNAFLDSNRDGNTDLGDVMKFANRFLTSA